MERDRLDHRARKPPQVHHVGPGGLVIDAEQFLFDLVQRAAFAAGSLENARVLVRHVLREHEDPRVVNHARGEGVFRRLGVAGMLLDEAPRPAGDRQAVRPERPQAAPFDDRGVDPVEQLGAEHERAEGRKPQEDRRALGIAHPVAHAEIRGIDDAEQLCRHARIPGDQPADLLHRGVRQLEPFDQFLEQFRHGRDRLEPAHQLPQAVVVQKFLEDARALDRALQQVGVARFRQVLMGGADRPQDQVHIGVTREDDPHRPRVAVADAGEQLGAVHAGHAHVRHDDVELVLFEQLQRRLRPAGEVHLPVAAPAAQHPSQSVEDHLLVVDEQHAQAHRESSMPASGTVPNRTTNRAPPRSDRPTEIVPLCRQTIPSTMASPCPVPLPTSFVV